MRIDVLTLFPEMFGGPLQASIVGRAVETGLAEIVLHNTRDYAEDKHHIVDDYTFGGGPGMLMKPEPLFSAVEAVAALDSPKGRVVLLTPQGPLLTQAIGDELAREERLILVCGHYEGVDERILDFVDMELSVGDFVLTGGEIPAMAVIDSVARLLPGVLLKPEAAERESFSAGLLDFPQYTRPSLWRGRKVPPALLSGDHARIEAWRRRAARAATRRKRPDLL